jgi:pantoate--beta-alanine ligase
MQVCETIADLRRVIGEARKSGKSIGFVPTMGALHQGHLSLVHISKQRFNITVVSIFVNPTQFGPNEDFAKYPRTIEDDKRLLEKEGVDILFLPSVQEMYPDGRTTSIHVGEVTELFEGAIRPGHFDGVATVVAILFDAVQPDGAIFGQKDAQQVAVIKRMVRDLAFPINIIVGDTSREKDGLAMSSRNRYLSPDERQEAVSVSRALKLVIKMLSENQSVEKAKSAGISEFERLSPNAKLEYLDIVDSETFRPVTSFEPLRQPVTAIIAARFGSTRLIDNLPLNP